MIRGYKSIIKYVPPNEGMVGEMEAYYAYGGTPCVTIDVEHNGQIGDVLISGPSLPDFVEFCRQVVAEFGGAE